MRKYETMFIVNPTLSQEETKGLVSKFKAVIEGAGKIEKVDEWGKRRLAYEIDDHKDGYYFLINFEAEQNLITELERSYKLTEGVLRYLTINKEE